MSKEKSMPRIFYLILVSITEKNSMQSECQISGRSESIYQWKESEILYINMANDRSDSVSDMALEISIR